MTTKTTSELHQCLAITLDGRAFTDGTVTWDAAQAQWRRHDEARLAGRRPQVRHYIVRSVDDPTYRPGAGVRWPFQNVVGSRGYNTAKGAARAAIHRRYPQRPDGRGQGLGGWFYANGPRPIAQGLDDLARVLQRRGWIVQGQDGRWFPTVEEAR